jgi:hypothetical protein
MTRHLQSQQRVLRGRADGDVDLVARDARAGTHAGALYQGTDIQRGNIIRMSAVLSSEAQFGEYEMIGQSAEGTDEIALRPHGIASDGASPWQRPRRKIILDIAENSPQALQRRAEWERDRARVVGQSRDHGARVPRRSRQAL